MCWNFRLFGVAICFAILSSYANTTIENPTKRKGAGALFRIMRGEVWGYMDRAGQTRITPQFEMARDFMGGLAAVRVSGKWGFIREDGSFAIIPRFDAAGDFVEDLAAVRIGRLWGFIDRFGDLLIKPQFPSVADFNEGLARVHIWDTPVCASGEQYEKGDAADYLYRYLLPGVPLHGGDCSPQDGRFGFINKAGALVIPARFAWAEDLSEGLALARIDSGLNAKYGYIDRTGSWVISPRFNQAKSFSEGLAAVEINSRLDGNRRVDIQQGYIDKSGRLAIPAIFQFVGSFSEGLARVGVSSGRMGFIDRDGRLVIAARFNEARDFSEGLASACDDEGCSYINRSGVSVVKGSDAWWPFVDGLAIVPRSGYPQTYIDNTGRVVARYN